MTSEWNCWIVFSHVYTGVIILGDLDHEGKASFISCHTKGIHHQCGVCTKVT